MNFQQQKHIQTGWGSRFLNTAILLILILGIAIPSAALAAPTSNEDETNIAQGKPATQSSTVGAYCGPAVAALAVDGNTDGNLYACSITHTDEDAQAWWQVDLQAIYHISSIDLWNRTDAVPERLSNFDVLVSSNGQTWAKFYYPGTAGVTTNFVINAWARYVKVQLRGTNNLSLAEVKVWSEGMTIPPIVAGDDSYSTNQDTPLTVAARGVMENDHEEMIEESDLSAVKVSDPAHGAVTLNTDGSFTYTPAAGYVGSDSFTYMTTNDLIVSNIATVTIDVLSTVGDSGQLGYWKFDDGTGTIAVDSSGSTPANNGTLSGGAAFSASAAPITSFANPGALSVTGTSASLVSVPNSAINKLTNNFTVMGWINPGSISGIQRVIATARTKTGSNGWGFGLNSNWLYFSVYGKASYLTPLSTGMSSGKWYHIAAVMDSSNAVTFYVDGIAVGTVANAGPVTADPDDVLQIGAGTPSGSSSLTEPFNGLIDEVRVYYNALSAAEIADAVAVAPCSETVLRARVMLGEKSGTITLDGTCTYPLASAGDTANGGSGIKVSTATTIEGNGATIERKADAPMFRLLTISPAITIRNLTLRGGNVYNNGGGLYAFGNLTLENVRFEKNIATNTPGATYVNTGGALSAAGNLSVNRSFFLGNQAGGFGGAINFTGSTGSITNSVFANNVSGASGAAVRASNAAGSITLLNNTFTDAYHNTYEAFLTSGKATVKNNIFDNFKSGLTASGASAVVSEDYNLFAADDSAIQMVSGGTVNSGDHSRIAALPRFVNPATANYHLQANSPAIDLGTDAGVSADADGNSRPMTGTAADIGAFEYQGVGIPSVSITKVGPPVVGGAGQSKFILTIINEGTSTLSNLRIVDTLPAGATYVAGSASNDGTFAGGTLTWDLASLDPNRMARVWYQVTASQDLVSSGYTVTSTTDPAIAASGPAFTTPFNANYTALGFTPYPDGYSFANWGGGEGQGLETDVTVADMVSIYGTGVCKTQNPCVLTASAEAERQAMIASGNGGHCGGMAMSSMWIYDRADVVPGTYQEGALTTFELNKTLTSRNLITYFHSTQVKTPVITTGLAPYTAATGASNVVNALLENFANPAASTRYTLWFYKMDWTGGHAVVPNAVKKIDDDHYWIYVYDVNHPNNFDRVFKVTMSTSSWVYEGGATNPTAPASTYWGDNTIPGTIRIMSLRWAESFPKRCTTACAPDATATSALVGAASVEMAQSALSSSYEFQLDGEGYLMITRSDGKRAGYDRATGAFIAEIPGAEQIMNPGGMGLNIPDNILIPHTAGMSYTLQISDRPNAYGNPSTTTSLNIMGDSFVTRLKGLKLDSPADPETGTSGANDVLGITFDGDNHRVGFTSSALDNDTPSLGMAISQNGKPDFSFEISGAQMPSGRTLSVAIDPATGKLSVENDDPASNTYNLNVERINLDGSKTTYSGPVSESAAMGTTVDLGPDWNGGQLPISGNTGPVANNDNYTVNANTALTVSAQGVVRNDTGLSQPTVIKVSVPAHGTLTLNADGSFVYTPDRNYVGSDSFTYKVSTGLFESNIATVNLTVKWINYLPIISSETNH